MPHYGYLKKSTSMRNPKRIYEFTQLKSKRQNSKKQQKETTTKNPNRIKINIWFSLRL